MTIRSADLAVTFPERSRRTAPVMSQAAPVAAPGPTPRFRLASPATALVAGAVVLALMIAEFPLASLAHQTVDAGGGAPRWFSVPFAVIGFLVAYRKPGNRLGWILLGLAAFLAVAEDASFYVAACYRLRHGGLPFGWVALLAQPTWSIATQFQGLTAPGHPEVRWAYAVFDVSLVLSALVAGFGGLPLWLLMLCRDGREHRLRDLVYLLLPLIAPAAYLAALIVTIRLVGGPQGVSPWWFLVVTLAGFAAAATAAAGPGLALRRLQPRGPALRLAAAAAGLAAAVMAVAAVAIVVAVIGLCLWERHFAGYHHGTIPGAYLALVVAATAVTTVSAARGTRAALTEPQPQ
jgi:hypothetical protein